MAPHNFIPFFVVILICCATQCHSIDESYSSPSSSSQSIDEYHNGPTSSSNTSVPLEEELLFDSIDMNDTSSEHLLWNLMKIGHPLNVLKVLSENLYKFFVRGLQNLYFIIHLDHEMVIRLHSAQTYNTNENPSDGNVHSSVVSPSSLFSSYFSTFSYSDNVHGVHYSTSTNNVTPQKEWSCARWKNYRFLLYPSAQRVNAHRMMDLLDSHQNSPICSIVLVFTDRCPFSAQAVPVFNSLSRLYPHINFVAIHVNDFWMFRWSLNIFYVPSIKLYYGNRKWRDYLGNDTSLDELVAFIHNITGMLPQHYFPINVTDKDRLGPVQLDLSDSRNGFDMLLLISWLLTFVCTAYLLHYVNAFHALASWQRWPWNRVPSPPKVELRH